MVLTPALGQKKADGRRSLAREPNQLLAQQRQCLKALEQKAIGKDIKYLLLHVHTYYICTCMHYIYNRSGRQIHIHAHTHHFFSWLGLCLLSTTIAFKGGHKVCTKVAQGISLSYKNIHFE